jgi:ABC-type dipeptide/oligopeptide/nickel transport system permease component
MALTPALADGIPVEIEPDGPAATDKPAGRRRGRWGLRAGRQGAESIGVIWAVVTITFLVTRVFAPDPTALFLGASGNGFATPGAAAAAKAQVQATLGLDTPILSQYGRFLGQVLHGDLGTSFVTGRAVTADLAARFPATAELAVYALIVGVTFGVLLGVLSAVRGGWFDRVARLTTVGAIAMPQFWIGLMLLWLFSTKLHLAPGPVGRLPVGVTPPPSITGFYVIDAVLQGRWYTATQAAGQLVLPVVTLALGLGAPICKVVRTSMLETLSSDHVRTATALGLGRRRVLFGYALKNGLLPVITILAGIIAFTFAGSILVEGIFGWPGIGNYSLLAIRSSDFPAIQCFVVYAAVLYVVIYEALNFLYAVVDPRVRS